MHSVSDRGIIIKRERHLDQDARIVVLLRETGKVIITARGIQKQKSRLKALVEPFIEADFHLMLPEHGVYGRLISGVLVNSHIGIRNHMPSFVYASQCAEVIQQMIPNRMPTPAVYDILQATFRSFDGIHSPEQHWILFVTSLLKILGHQDIEPEMTGQSPARRLAIVQYHLEQHLPWRLKSEVSNLI